MIRCISHIHNGRAHSSRKADLTHNFPLIRSPAGHCFVPAGAAGAAAPAGCRRPIATQLLVVLVFQRSIGDRITEAARAAHQNERGGSV